MIILKPFFFFFVLLKFLLGAGVGMCVFPKQFIFNIFIGLFPFQDVYEIHFDYSMQISRGLLAPSAENVNL